MKLPLIVIFAASLALGGGASQAGAQGADAGSSSPEENTAELLIATGHNAFAEHRFDDAISAYEKVLAEEPFRFEVYQPLSKSYAYLGLFDQAEKRVSQLYLDAPAEAYAALPQGEHYSLAVGGHCRLALFESLQGNREQALQHAEAVLSAGAKHMENVAYAPYCGAVFLTRWGELDRAAELWNHILAHSSGPEAVASLIYALDVAQQRGDTRTADQLRIQLQRLVSAFEAGQFPQMELDPIEENIIRARIAAVLGKRGSAIEYVRKAYQAGSRMYYYHGVADPVLHRLAGDPEYDELLSQIDADVELMRQQHLRASH